MKRFSVGQEVVAVKDAPPDNNENKYPPYKKGIKYKVQALLHCRFCGHQHIDVGLDYLSPILPDVFSCDFCHAMQSTGDSIGWADSEDFAPLQEIDDLIKQAIEAEDYETAAALTKTI